MNKNLLLSLFLATTLAACGSPVRLDDSPPAQIENRGGADKSAQETAGQPSDSAVSAGQTGADREITPVEATAPAPTDPLQDATSLLGRRSIFFDYDSFTIREEFRPIVEAHARYLISNQGKKLVLQGNTDERGSREYNVALGQKRAEAVRRALTILGVNDSQLEAVSFGEERPRNQGRNEEAYAENRRADLDYQ